MFHRLLWPDPIEDAFQAEVKSELAFWTPWCVGRLWQALLHLPDQSRHTSPEVRTGSVANGPQRDWGSVAEGVSSSPPTAVASLVYPAVMSALLICVTTLNSPSPSRPMVICSTFQF